MLDVKIIFDNIYKNYDFLNKIFSFGLDVFWRRRAVREAKIFQEDNVLDIGCGTGELSKEIKKKTNNIVGIDFSEKMIELAKKKVDGANFMIMNGEKLDFPENNFDKVLLSFVIRNMKNINCAFKEIKRVLKPDGRLVILELGIPENSIFKKIHWFYISNFIPLVGYIFSGYKNAYLHLPNSIRNFYKRNDLESILKTFGFKNVYSKRLILGAVYFIIAEK